MRYAFESGCDLALMVAAAGSESQRNAERKGFRIASTRMKWRLSSDGGDRVSHAPPAIESHHLPLGGQPDGPALS